MEDGPRLPPELVDAVVRMRPAPEWMLVCHATRAMLERAARLYAFMRRRIEPVDIPEYRLVPPTDSERIGADAQGKERERVRESRAIAREFRDAVAATLAGPDPRAAIECVLRPALARLVVLQDERFAVWTKQQEARIDRAATSGIARLHLEWKERRAPHALHPLRRLRQLVAESFGRAGVAGPEAVPDLLPPRPVPRWRRRVTGVRHIYRNSVGDEDISFEEHARRRPGNIRTKVEIAFVRGLARTERWDAVVERLAVSSELGKVARGARCTCVGLFSRRSARLRLGRLFADAIAIRDRADRRPAEIFARIADAAIGFRLGHCDEGACACELRAARLCEPIGRAAGTLPPSELERVGRALDGWLSACRYVEHRSGERVDGRVDPDERRMGMLAFWTECARATAHSGVVELCCGAGGALLPIAGHEDWEFERPRSALLCAASLLVLAPDSGSESLRAAGAACDLAAALGADPLLGLAVRSIGCRRPADPSTEAAERVVAWACARWSPDSARVVGIAMGVPAGPYADAWDARAHPGLLMERCAANPSLMEDRNRVERLIARCSGEPQRWWRDRVVRPICADLRSWDDSGTIPTLGPVGCCLRLLRPDLFASVTLEADMCCEGGCPICEHRGRPALPDRKPGDPVSFAFGLPGEEVRGTTDVDSWDDVDPDWHDPC